MIVRDASPRSDVRPDSALPTRAARDGPRTAFPVLPRAKPSDGRRLRCADVAQNRAARYARRHRNAKSFKLLIAAAIFVGLLFERRPAILALRAGMQPDPARDNALPPKHGSGSGWHPEETTADEREDDAPQPRYRPPEDFLARDAAQVVAFLVRNRGRVDNDVTGAKWDLLDEYSLPLAIYLREVEATGAWDDLEKEVRTARLRPGTPARSDMPKSIRHQKILTLLPDWSGRGEDILSGSEADDPALASDTKPEPPNMDTPTP